MAHTGITVSDMERALHFYRDLLGLKMLGDLFFTIGRRRSRMASRPRSLIARLVTAVLSLCPLSPLR
jgi:hypothetical protein